MGFSDWKLPRPSDWKLPKLVRPPKKEPEKGFFHLFGAGYKSDGDADGHKRPDDVCMAADEVLSEYMRLREDFITVRDYNRFRRKDDNRSDEELFQARLGLTSVYYDLKSLWQEALGYARACSEAGGNTSTSDVPRLPAFPEKEY